MNSQPQNLFSIGSFASAARLSLKALRLYDQLDILKPSYVDPNSGYRYYQSAQLRQARLVRMMRQNGYQTTQPPREIWHQGMRQWEVV